MFRGYIKSFSQKKYAIKLIPKQLSYNPRTVILDIRVEREIKNISICEHENVIKIVDYVATKNNIYIVLEYC